MQSNAEDSLGTLSDVGLILGPIAAGMILIFGAPADLSPNADHLPDAWITLSLLTLMAIWWVTEAIPIPVTSLLPLIVLPLTGVSTMADVAAPYMHPIVVLLMGGFMFARAIESWNLHERIALLVVSRARGSPSGLIGAFMLAAAVLSMWISNSATSIMMMPIALSVAAAVENRNGENNRQFTYAMVLGIAYACSIGGLGTPIGTPTNLIVLGYLSEQRGQDIGFADWMTLGIPVVAILLPLTWLVLTRWAFRMPDIDTTAAHAGVNDRLRALKRMTQPEWRTVIVFLCAAGLWVFRRPLNGLEISVNGQTLTPLAGLTDHMTAIIAVMLCFIIPAGGGSGKKLLSWREAEQIPWGVLLLFGGGMSLAQAISGTGLSGYVGQNFSGIASLPIPVMIFLIALVVLALTEVTSNIATASALMPVVGALAIETGRPLEMIAVPVALAASCAFMLPMATGPNAVAFATGEVSLQQMARTGYRVNLVALVVITVATYFLAPAILG